jgi:LysM repeat protein
MRSALADDSEQHQVQNGDTLWAIAEKYGARADDLVKLNNLEFPDLLLPGDVIQVPVKHEPPPPNGVYAVEPGDTLGHIAVRFDVALQELRKANGLIDTDLIVPGQQLQIPGTAAPAAPPEPVRHPPDDEELETMFNELSGAEGLDPSLVKAIAWLESGWQQHAVSSAGAVGFMQITPVTAEWLETAVFGEPLNEDVSMYDNVKMGARYLRILMDVTGEEDKAIASYYQGYGTTLSGKIYEETKHYVELVKAIRAAYWG